MNTYLLIVPAILIGYLLGSVPSGVWVCRLLGKDPRRVGSGRTGGTNVYRTAGPWAAAATVALDIAKGALAVWLAVLAQGRLGAAPPGPPDAYLVGAAAALAAIVGHNHSLFLGFTGGAGSSPNMGAALMLLGAPVTLTAVGVATLVLVVTRYASLASLTLSVGLALGGLLLVRGAPLPLTGLAVFALGQLVLVAWALRPNLRRLLAGTERRVGAPLEEPRPE